MNRRHFLGSIAALTTTQFIAAHPKPWEVPGAIIENRAFVLHGEAIVVAGNVVMRGCSFVCIGHPPCQHWLVVPRSAFGIIRDCTFEWKPVA